MKFVHPTQFGIAEEGMTRITAHRHVWINRDALQYAHDCEKARNATAQLYGYLGTYIYMSIAQIQRGIVCHRKHDEG